MLVTFHATIREAAGISRAEMEAETVHELLLRLRERYGDRLFELIIRDNEIREDVVILVNGRNLLQLAGLETPLNSDDEIAIFPPISGG